MSQITDTPENAANVGQTSDEANEANEDKKGLFGQFTVFDAMLLISVVCVVSATLILVFELRTFGDFPFGYPWRVDEVVVNPITGN